MSKTVILAFDVGTSGTKTSIVRADNGMILDSASSSHQTWFLHSGWAEQEPEDWWEGICRNTKQLIEKNPDVMNNIAAIGTSGHMLGCLPVDADGKALRRSMLHSDIRSAEQFSHISKSIGVERMYRMTGNILDCRSSLCKVLWVKQNEPEVYNRTARFLQSKDYIVSRLTGNIDITDLSDASHAQFIDIYTKDYDSDILKELGLEREKFPTIHRGTDVVGRLTPESARALGLKDGIPVIAGSGDGACASVGAGVVSPGDAYCCLGTTAWIAYASTAPVIDPAQRIFNLLSVDGKTCGVYGTVQSAGRSMQWAMELFNEKNAKEFDRLAASVMPGSEGLIFLPYLEGERSPIFDTEARGVFFGLSPLHGKKHLMRAVLEGVAFALRSVLDVYRETLDIGSMRMIGGGAYSSLWREIISNVCNITLETLTVPPGDATSLGAAIAAGVGIGLYPDLKEGVQSISVGIKERRMPNEKWVQIYEQLFGVYQSIYPQLKPVYKSLSGIRLNDNQTGNAI